MEAAHAGGGRCGCSGRVPQTADECCFFFLKISSYSSLLPQTSAWPLTQPNSPTRLGTIQVRVRCGRTLPSWHPQSQWVHTTPVCLPLRPYPLSDFKHPGPFRGCSNLPVWQGRKPLTWFFPKNPVAYPAGARRGLQSSYPCAGPKDLIVPKQSPYCLIFQCPLEFWPPIFIYAGILLAVHSVPQRIS